MSSKQIALMQVAKLVSSVLLTAVAINVLLLYFTTFQIIIGGCTMLLVYLLKTVYDMEFDRAEHQKKLDALSNKSDES